MIVSMDKMYTLDGEVFTILTVKKPGNLPVLGYSLSGMAHDFREDGSSPFCCLVEVSPYADFVIDEKVMVREHGAWTKRHFAGVNSEGIARAWDSGRTRWTSNGLTCTWPQCRRPTAEELAS